MPEPIIGVDYSGAIISDLEKALNNKGVRVHSATSEADGTHLVAEGLGNKKQHSIIIANLPDKPSDEDAAKLVDQYLEQVESGLRSAPMPVEEAE